MTGESHTRSAALPAEVQAFAARAAAEAPVEGQVRITQRGEMWLKPGGRAMRFTAVQELTIERIEFSWRARFPLMGPLALSVVDAYDGEKGELAVRVVGLPLQRQRGPETTAGQAIRYLAELA